MYKDSKFNIIRRGEGGQGDMVQLLPQQDPRGKGTECNVAQWVRNEGL